MDITKYKNTSVGLIPIDWEVKKLEEIGLFSKGKGILKAQVLESGLPCIRYGEIYTTHNFIIKEFKSYISEEVADESQEISKGDILFAGSGETIDEIGKAVVYLGNEKAYAGGDTIIFKPEKDNSETISYILETDSSKKQKRTFGQGNSVVHIYPSDLKKLKIPIPPIQEQQKIATIISTWDKAIDNCKVIIEKLNDRNKGLAQQLLSGKMRVKGFEEKWKTMKLSDFSNNRNSSLSINNLESNIGQFPLYGANRIIQRIDFFESEDPYISIIKDGAGVGRVFLCEGKSSIVGTMAYIKSNEKSTLNFLFHLLKLIKFESFITGSTIPHIYYSSYGKKRFDIPNIEEQKAIANILDKATQELKQFEQKLQTLQLQKKGLMQQLLTGKTRVKIS